MILKGFITFCWLILLSAQVCVASELVDKYKFVCIPITTVYESMHHQNGSQVWWIDQADDGSMIFACANGLSTFDGEHWQHANLPNNTRVRSISQWHDGNIYAGGFNTLGFFKQNKNGQKQYQAIDLSHLNHETNETWSVSSNTSQVAFSTDTGLYQWDGKLIKQIKGINSFRFRLFNLEGEILFKPNNKSSIYQLTNTGQLVKKPWQVPAKLNIKSLMKNKKNEIIAVSMYSGIYKLFKNKFVKINTSKLIDNAGLYSATQAKDGYYYINSVNFGLYILDESFALVRHYNKRSSIGLTTIYHTFIDKQDNIWLAGSPSISVFQPPHLRSEFLNSEDSNDFENLFKIEDQMFFSGTGLYHLSTKDEQVVTPEFKRVANFNHFIWDIVKVDNHLLVGTENGVYRFLIDNQFNLSTPEKILAGRFFVDLAKHPHKNIVYAGEDEQIFRLEKKGQHWEKTPLVNFNGQADYVVIDKQYPNVLWVSTTEQKLYKISDIDNQGIAQEIIQFSSEDYPLGKDHVVPINTAKGIRIGTQNGMLKYQPQQEVKFTLDNQYPEPLRTNNKNIFIGHEDKKQRLWYQAGFDAGIAYQDKQGVWQADETLLNPYGVNGVRGLSYFNDAIWIGVTGAKIYRFDEQVIGNNPKGATLKISFVKPINTNQLLEFSSTNSLLTAIENEHNSIRIGFSLTDYSSLDSVKYRSRLLGQGHDFWTPWSSENIKDFTLLSGGNYTFEIEAIDGWQRKHTEKLTFTVLPSWYLSTTAKFVYLLLALLIILLSIYIGQKWRSKQLLKHNKELQQKVAQRTRQVEEKVEQLREQQQLKDRFFANISHEFRTPLTLTIGPLRALLDDYSSELKSTGKKLAETALSNANKMLALIGQVLDLNRLEAGKLQLRVSEYKILPLLEELKIRFEPWSKQFNQQISIEVSNNKITAFVDIEQLEKCLSNLLSNAIKYSGNNTHIKLSLRLEEHHIVLKVSDNGQGLSKENLRLIFDRFYQGKNSEKSTIPGTGIGLALVKEVVELHHGQVSAESKLGSGCCFSLIFKQGSNHFDSAELIEPIILSHDEVNIDNTVAIEEQHTNHDLEDITTILVVDDNSELRDFISLRLSRNFQIIQAENGIKGYELACSALPDLIISDVSMPEMDGLELTKKIKHNTEIQCIPVLLLTAKTTKREIVEGFSSGADDYLTKPFDTSELIMRVNALLNTQKMIRQSIEFTQAAKESGLGEYNSFLNQFNQLITLHISDPKVKVEQLASEMKLSKETLTRRCRDEIGISPKAYIQKTRLQHSTKLLKEKRLTISEIAYAVGFESLAYFSRRFKLEYNKTPSEYIQSK